MARRESMTRRTRPRNACAPPGRGNRNGPVYKAGKSNVSSSTKSHHLTQYPKTDAIASGKSIKAVPIERSLQVSVAPKVNKIVGLQKLPSFQEERFQAQIETYSEGHKHLLRNAEIHFEMASQHLVWAEHAGEDPASHHLDAHLQTVAGLEIFFEVWERKLHMKVDQRSIINGVPYLFVVCTGHGCRLSKISRFSRRVGDKYKLIPYPGRSLHRTFPGGNADGLSTGAPLPHRNGVDSSQEYGPEP